MEMPVTDGVACDATEVTWGDGSSIPSGEEGGSRGWDSEGALEGEEQREDGRHGCKPRTSWR